MEETEIKCEGLQHFIERAKRIIRLTKLTPEIVHEFIEKIVVPAPGKINDKRHHTVDIYYYGAGIIKMVSAEKNGRNVPTTYFKTTQSKNGIAVAIPFKLQLLSFNARAALG